MTKGLFVLGSLFMAVAWWPSPAATSEVCEKLSFRRDAEIQAGAQPNSVVAADFNNDGVIDMAVTNSGANDIARVLELLCLNGNRSSESGQKRAVGT